MLNIFYLPLGLSNRDDYNLQTTHRVLDTKRSHIQLHFMLLNFQNQTMLSTTIYRHTYREYCKYFSVENWNKGYMHFEPVMSIHGLFWRVISCKCVRWAKWDISIKSAIRLFAKVNISIDVGRCFSALRSCEMQFPCKWNSWKWKRSKVVFKIAYWCGVFYLEIF